MNKELKSASFYQSSDLCLVAAISLWCPIEDIDRTNIRKATFHFKKNEKLNELLDLYWKRQLKVEPQSYFNQLKAIKARLYSEK